MAVYGPNHVMWKKGDYNNVTYFMLTRRIIYRFWILYSIYWLYRLAEFTIDSCTRNPTVLQFAYSLVITLKTFTTNHNTQSRCNTLCTVLILHRVIPCILTCVLLAASLIHLLTELARPSNWRCTAFSISYQRWNLTRGERNVVNCCA
jgi:hypothetical protein